MRKTKIICTLGPATDNDDVLEQLIIEGMDVARFNFSHNSCEEQKERMDKVKALRAKHHRPVACLLDTKGPEIRIKTFKNGSIHLERGQDFCLTTRDVEGTEEIVSVTYEDFIKDISVGSSILIDDGLIELEVVSIEGEDAHCQVVNGGTISNRKGVNLPGVKISMPYLSDKDRADILFGIQEDVDFIAASFTRNAGDIRQIRQLLKENGGEDIHIIAKVENAEGIENIDEIIEASDGVMVARGDMGVEIPEEEVPILQKMIIHKVCAAGKVVITATQMLDSMIRNPRPTRAEVTDVANAVYDGTDAVMLSGETAQGKYPLEALQMMVHIIENTEQHLEYETMLEKAGGHLKSGLSSAIGYSSVLAASNLNAKCIITPTVTGATTRVVSNLRPRQDILGVTPNERTLRRMSIYWGVRPLKSMQFSTTDDICDGAIELAKVKQYAESGDIVVLTAGIPSPNVRMEHTSASNMMRIATVE